MAKTEAARAREERQGRVARIVWGIALIAMGVLFTLDNLGRIDMRDSGGYPPSHVVDGDPGTRWSSAFADPQWIAIDLGEPAEITRVSLNWEAAYATAYEIEVSDDGSSWTPVKSVTNGPGGIDDQEVKARGRYVRVGGTKRATPYGYSLWEMEVYGTPAGETALPTDAPSTSASLLSRGKPVTASSREGTNLWFLYWPVLMIVGGLPALIAPKDGADQVVGLLSSGAGVLLQLQKLRAIAWKFSEAWPILLIVTGLLLVLQAWRAGKGETTTGASAPGESAR